MTEAAVRAMAALVARAGTMGERRRGRAVRGEADDAARRLSNWQRVVARDDIEQWVRRLEFDEIDAATAAAMVEVDQVPANADEAWTDIARAVLTAAEQPWAPGDRVLDARAPVPFEDVLLPFIAVARGALNGRAGDTLNTLTAAAHVQLERALLCRLSAAAAALLYREFTAAGGVYRQFTANLRSGGWPTLFERHAALVRFLVVRTTLWIDATTELLARIEADRTRLADHFSAGVPTGPVVQIDPELSDSHNGGRMVALLHFENGLRVAYKPRSLAAELAYAHFVTWMNSAGTSPALRALRVLNCGSHGWMECADPLECVDAVSVHRYYRRAGLIACTMYVLGGQDLHSGNVIAAGEHPLLFDLEALMQPLLPEEGIGDAAAVGSWRHIHRSVLSTYLLPLLSRSATGATHIEGGFAATDTTRPALVRQWRDVNTDNMALYEESIQLSEGVNVPSDGLVPPDEQLSQFLAGFRSAYRLFIRHRAALVSPDGPLAPFRDLHVRLLLRPTDVYGTLLRRSLRPDALTTGVDRSITLDILHRPFLRGEPRHRLWQAVQYEISQLEMGDIPVFQIAADGQALIANDQVVVPAYAESSGFEQALSRVQSLGAADALRQLGFARIAWTMYRVRRARARTVGEPAIAIAETLGALATRANGVDARWMTLGDTGFMSTDLSFGNGRAGIAFFLAALEHTVGYRTRDLALAAIHPLIRDRSDVNRIARSHGIGGVRGLGGMVYALTRIAHWLDEPRAIDAANRLAAGLTSRRIAADQKFDVFDGVAGAILGLLTLHTATGSELALDRALECAHHLLRQRARDDVTGCRVWPTTHGELTGGFAHGAAGIACALGRLRPHADTALTAAIDVAINDARVFEASLFAPESGNWFSTRRAQQNSTNRPPAICGWCHGAAGIGLGRLALLDITRDPSLHTEIEAALNAMAPYEEKLAAQDHLCCGNTGRIELLHLAGIRLGRPELIKRSRTYAEKTVKRSHDRTTYGAGSVDEGFAPSLLFGLAGIGYQLLRLDYSDRLPSLLIWE